MCLALAAACGARPSRSTAGSSSSERDLQVAVERLRLERRLRERKIRDLENQLATRGETPAQAMSEIPNLPVQVLGPKGGARAANDAGERAEVSRLAPVGGRGAANDNLPDANLLDSNLPDNNLPGELTVDGERVVGVADDGSEIVYVDDAATGRVVAPSPEALAEIGRGSGGRRASVPAGAGSPDIDEGNARELLDSDGGVASADRIPPMSGQLSSIGRRAARTRTQPTRLVMTPPPASPAMVTTAPVAGPPTPPIAAAGKSPQPSVRGSDNGAAETSYREAIAQIRRAEYAEAITSLRAFLERYARHDYADNAQYWLGEAFYAQRQYAQALVELRRVGELYPQGNKVPDAMLKVGYCHLAMGDRDEGQRALREVIRLYPRSQPALLAAKKLEEGK